MMKSAFRPIVQWSAVSALALGVVFTPATHAQARKDTVVLGMVLEPTGLDPTTASAAAIGEVVH